MRRVCCARRARADPPDVVAATLAELAARDDWGPDANGRRAYLAEVERDCAAWDPAAALGCWTGGPARRSS